MNVESIVIIKSTPAVLVIPQSVEMITCLSLSLQHITTDIRSKVTASTNSHRYIIEILLKWRVPLKYAEQRGGDSNFHC